MDTHDQHPEPAEEVLYHVYYYCSQASGNIHHNNQLLDNIRKVTERYLMKLERRKIQAERGLVQEVLTDEATAPNRC